MSRKGPKSIQCHFHFSVLKEKICTDGSVPVLAQRRDDSLLNGSSTGATDRDAHLVVTPEAEELVLRHKNRKEWELSQLTHNGQTQGVFIHL